MRCRPTEFWATKLENAGVAPMEGPVQIGVPKGQEKGQKMIDAEVLRLRKLRNVALRARALAITLDSGSAEGSSVFARSALVCWAIARLASGRLRAHPYVSFQSGPSRLRELLDGLLATLVASTARRRNRSLSVYAQHLQTVARELDDVRSLTWSTDLGDALGRMQSQMRRLNKELDIGALGETGAAMLPRAVMAHPEASDSRGEIAVDGSWPYLAIQ
jgi:hypothetical protein